MPTGREIYAKVTHDWNVAREAKDDARRAMGETSLAMENLAKEFNDRMIVAFRQALASGSPLLEPYITALASANESVEAARNRWKSICSLYDQQKAAFEKTKADHELFVENVKGRTKATAAYLNNLGMAEKVKNDVMRLEGLIQMHVDSLNRRIDVLRTAKPLVWRLYNNETSRRVPAQPKWFDLKSRLAEGLRDTDFYRAGIASIAATETRINDIQGSLSVKRSELAKLDHEIQQVVDNEAKAISVDLAKVESAEKSYKAAATLIGETDWQLVQANQCVSLLEKFQHPAAELALEAFTDFVTDNIFDPDRFGDVAHTLGDVAAAEELRDYLNVSEAVELELVATLHEEGEMEKAALQTMEALEKIGQRLRYKGLDNSDKKVLGYSGYMESNLDNGINAVAVSAIAEAVNDSTPDFGGMQHAA